MAKTHKVSRIFSLACLAIGLILSVLSMSAVHAAPQGLCYDQQTQTVSQCPAKNTDGTPMIAADCYIKPFKATAWEMFDCSSPVFSQGTGNLGQIASSNVDPQTVDCNTLPTARQQPGKNCAGCTKSSNQDQVQCNGIITDYINPFLIFLTTLVGVVVVIGIITGGIQYASSAGDPQKAAKARKHIESAIVALVAYGFLFAFLQWLIPGGLIH